MTVENRWGRLFGIFCCFIAVLLTAGKFRNILSEDQSAPLSPTDFAVDTEKNLIVVL